MNLGVQFPNIDSMIEQSLKACNKNGKNSDIIKKSGSTSKKQSRKGENPIRFTSPDLKQKSPEFVTPTTRICKNSACRALLSKDVKYCKRCSCCVCYGFDENKDPSLWLICESESGSGSGDSCGLSCHVECALDGRKLGVVNPGQYMHLDGSYCCVSCGRVSEILGCWKKQLAVAKDARRVDVLCYRVYLSYRLLKGTAKFKELHEIITEAKRKLEAEVGPINRDSVKMLKGLVGRLPTAVDVQKLCSNAIDKANQLLANDSPVSSNGKVDSPPASCRFLFEEITSSSLVIVLIDIPTPIADSIIGYKLSYCKSQEDISSYEPVSIFPREKRRITVNNLDPLTEYTFRIVSYTADGDLGHSEAKCSTKSLEIFNQEKETPLMDRPNSNLGGSESSGLGKILHLAWAQDQGFREGSSSADVELTLESPKIQESTPISRGLDLNVVSVPDLNEDLVLTPPPESSRDEDNAFALERAPDDDAASRDVNKNGPGLGRSKSNGNGPSDDSRVWAHNPNGEARKRGSSAKVEALDCDSTLMNGSPLPVSDGPGSLDENFEYCVKVIRSLECEGHIKQEFRLKLLTWFSLRSTEQERRVVNTFIRALMDDPKSLAAQLIDTFGELISTKRLRNSFTSVPS